MIVEQMELMTLVDVENSIHEAFGYILDYATVQTVAADVVVYKMNLDSLQCIHLSHYMEKVVVDNCRYTAPVVAVVEMDIGVADYYGFGVDIVDESSIVDVMVP